MRLGTRICALLLVLALLCPPTGSSGDSPPPPPTWPPDLAQNGTANNTTNATVGAVIPPRASTRSVPGYGAGAWGDFTKGNVSQGNWTKRVGDDGEVYLEWNDNGTVHKVEMSLVGFTGSTKTVKAPKETNTTRSYVSKEPVYRVDQKTGNKTISHYKNVTRYTTRMEPSEARVYGYLGTTPVTVTWREHPHLTKEEVTWNGTKLASVKYEIKTDSKNLTFNKTSLGLELDGVPIGAGLEPLVLEDANGVPIDLNWSVAKGKADKKDLTPIGKDEAYWTLTVSWSYPNGSKGPYVLDPSVSFDGTTFTIEDSQWEIKTYQQLWSIRSGWGTNVRYLGGWMAADTIATKAHIYIHKTFTPTLNLTDWTDFTVDIDTTNADAAWTFYFQWGTDSNNLISYEKSGLSGDISVTYTLSDLTFHTQVGDPDLTAISYMNLVFHSIDSAGSGSVTIKLKDIKFTTPIKTTDLYDDTGMAVLYNESFEGDDGLALDEYDSDWIVTVAGTSVVEIDDAQAPDGGDTSLLLYRDGANNPVARDKDILADTDYCRIRVLVRLSIDSGSLYIQYYEGASRKARLIFDADSKIGIYYGDGGGSTNEVEVAYSADTNYEVWADFDFTNNKWRVWIDGVMYPGPNADAAGFDNFYNDDTGTQIDDIRFASADGTGSYWVDGLKTYAGFEDFSALSAPHDPDDICEAVSPTNTDYGRQTWDGDWTTNGVSVAVDNTKVVIGTNSIKGNDLDYYHKLIYTPDTSMDFSSYINIRFYIYPETITTVRVYLVSSTGNDAHKELTVVADEWNYLDLEIEPTWSGWTTTGSPDLSSIQDVRFFNWGGLANKDMWVDGLHFYGDENAGVCFQGNQLELNTNSFVQDRAHYDIKGYSFTGSDYGGQRFTCEMTSSTQNLDTEFSDAAYHIWNANIKVNVSVQGYDPDHRIKWTCVGDVDPTTHPTASTAHPDPFVFRNVTLKWLDTIAWAAGGPTHIFIIDNCSWFPYDSSYSLYIYAMDDDATAYLINSYFSNLAGGNVNGVVGDSDVEALFCTFKKTNSGNAVRPRPDNWFAMKNCSWDSISLYDNSIVISKNTDNTSAFDIRVEDDPPAWSDIPTEFWFAIGSQVEVQYEDGAGNLNFDENITLQNGSFTRTSGTVNILNNTTLTMLNSTFTSGDFTISTFGLLLEKNWSRATPSVTGKTVSVAINNVTYYNWTPAYNQWNGSGHLDVYWQYDWGDGAITNTTNPNQSHTFGSADSQSITLGTVDLFGRWNNTTVAATTTGSYFPGGGNHPSITLTFHDSLWGVRFVPVIPSSFTVQNLTWYFGDGQTSAVRVPTHWYRHPGTYRVTLRVTLERAGPVEATATVHVGERSTLVKALHMVELTEEGLLFWFDGNQVVWPELGLFVGGAALLVSAYVQGLEARSARRRGFPDRLRGWRHLQLFFGALMILAVLYIELHVKGMMI